MYLTLLFDVEDLVDPRADDTTLRAARILTEEDAPSTMMIVGEKARLWEKRGRGDLIDAMAGHDIGLHTNRHSVHPTVAEYLEGKRWEDGIAEVVARERSGVDDMRRILGRDPSCWGRGGSTWGPQVAPALAKMGVPAMMYSFTHLPDPSRGVHYFCNTLSYYWFYGGFDEVFADEAKFDAAWGQAKDEIAGAVDSRAPWLGLFVSHPAMLRAEVFWDKLNYDRGINTPPEEWRLPEYRGEEEWLVVQRNLRRLAAEVARLPGVQLRTVREVNALVARQPERVQPDDLVALAREAAAADGVLVLDGANEGRHGGLPLHDAHAVGADASVRPVSPVRPGQPLPPISPAEALYLTALWLDLGRPEGALPWRYVEGPTAEPAADCGPLTLNAHELREGAAVLRRAVEASGRLPASVAIGQAEVGVGTLYRALAAACLQRGEVRLAPGAQVPAIGEVLAREVADGVPGWMHKPDLDVSTHAAYTRLQSWTLRPAVLR